jgi:beta-mannosidase
VHRRHDLSTLDWTLTGWAPYLWRAAVTMEIGAMTTPDRRLESVAVPGSVQAALLRDGILPDWNQAGNPEKCEWVENRHWMYEAVVPSDWVTPGSTIRLNCLGLDYSGWIFVDGVEVAEFRGTNVPHVIDLTDHLGDGDHRLRIVFDLPPRWLGQFGFTSRFTEWKTRFNYQWDWQPRLVQLGIWDDLFLEVVDGAELVSTRVIADAEVDPETGAGTGILRVSGEVSADAPVTVTLRSGDRILRSESVTSSALAAGLEWTGLDVELWWPNGQGAQPLYDVDIVASGTAGTEHDRRSLRVGFRNIVWDRVEGAPETSDTWLCIVNGRPIFLQGVNFPPMAALFADVTEQQYRERLELYREIGLNTFRINACQYLEKEVFYDICDELGLLVWQDLPITSSLIENITPSDPESIVAMEEIFRSFIARRHHHASLFLWSGGNEQFTGEFDGGRMMPIGNDHPMYARMKAVAEEADPGRRWIPASPTGPSFGYNEANVGQHLHENVHGPYGPADGGMEKWREYWNTQDAHFRAELGTPGTTTVEAIERYAGGLDPMPVDEYNAVWRRPVSWWVERAVFAGERGREPESLVEYVEWSQARQAESLAVAMEICKDRFPRNGGVLLWCGHDSYPTPTNCSIIDYDNTPKPAALALQQIWRRDFVAP